MNGDGGPLGKLDQQIEMLLFEGLTIGSVDMIYTGPNFAERDYGPIAISDYPFMLKNYDHWKAYRDSDLFKELSAGYKEATGHTVMAITW